MPSEYKDNFTPLSTAQVATQITNALADYSTTAETEGMINAAVPTEHFLVRTTDASKTSDTTAAADDVLQFEADANTKWAIEAVLLAYNGGGSAPSAVGVFGPAGATCRIGLKRIHVSTITSAQIVELASPAINTTASNRFASDAAEGASEPQTEIAGIVEVGDTAGTVSIAWAQASSSTTPTRVLKGSYLRARLIEA